MSLTETLGVSNTADKTNTHSKAERRQDEVEKPARKVGSRGGEECSRQKVAPAK